jgi:flagellar export protein FliJ
MTNRSRSARVLREVRTRLRDVAAASHAVAAATHDTTKRSLVAEEDRLEAFLDAAHHALAAARNVNEFELLAGHIDGHKQAIDGATEVHATSATRMKQSHLDLIASTRKLKTAEKIVERIDDERARVEARHEQRAQDDLSRRRADHGRKP